MKFPAFPQLFVLLFFLSACKKSKNKENTVSVHCDNLINLIRPGDNARIDIANAFTPNGDGLNDMFHPFLTSIQSVNLKIYDDQSKMIFETSQSDAVWSPGTSSNKYIKYYYRVEAVTTNGSTMSKCGDLYMLSCYPSQMNRNSFTFQDQYTGTGFTGVTAENLQTCP